MKTILVISLSILTFSFSNAQEKIPLINGDIEGMATLSKNKMGTLFSIKGLGVLRNKSNANKFDDTNSGLAPGKGVDGSQAFKAITLNTTGGSGHVSLISDPVEISNRGNGKYTYSFFVKAATQPIGGRPFFILVEGYDENDVKIKLTPVKNGGEQNTTGITAGFVEQTIAVDLNNTKVKKIGLKVQIGKEDNTYLFDNFTLTGPSISSK